MLLHILVGLDETKLLICNSIYKNFSALASKSPKTNPKIITAHGLWKFETKININPTHVYNQNEAEIQGFPMMYQVLRKYARKIIVYIIKVDE